MNQTDIRTFSWKKPLLWAVLILVAVVQIFPLIWLADFSLASSNEMFYQRTSRNPEEDPVG